MYCPLPCGIPKRPLDRPDAPMKVDLRHRGESATEPPGPSWARDGPSASVVQEPAIGPMPVLADSEEAYHGRLPS